MSGLNIMLLKNNKSAFKRKNISNFQQTLKFKTKKINKK